MKNMALPTCFDCVEWIEECVFHLRLMRRRYEVSDSCDNENEKVEKQECISK